MKDRKDMCNSDYEYWEDFVPSETKRAWNITVYDPNGVINHRAIEELDNYTAKIAAKYGLIVTRTIE